MGIARVSFPPYCRNADLGRILHHLLVRHPCTVQHGLLFDANSHQLEDHDKKFKSFVGKADNSDLGREDLT